MFIELLEDEFCGKIGVTDILHARIDGAIADFLYDRFFLIVVDEVAIFLLLEYYRLTQSSTDLLKTIFIHIHAALIEPFFLHRDVDPNPNADVPAIAGDFFRFIQTLKDEPVIEPVDEDRFV
jgi:hypothetical protein